LNGTSKLGLVSMSDTRLFIVIFAGFVILITWLLLSKTNLGLYIRAVMQNRNMASSLGIPVARVNSMTFAFGCGLASLAGATLSLVSNVGPSMGQTYIVDSFMVVVAGGLGNLIGAGISALGIGVIDQFLQPLLGPVMGKIVVLFAIILFLQWKPGGLFPTKSRSLDD
jgi:urea transport system permease protein